MILDTSTSRRLHWSCSTRHVWYTGFVVELVDRAHELDQLRRAYEAASGGTPQLVTVWGRRRVGKTFLLSEFVQDKRAVFHAATQQAEGVELRRLHEEVRRQLGEPAADLAGGGFSSWEAALRFCAALATEQPLVLVLDEVPYLAATTPGFASIVQAVWDHLRPGTRLLLVLTGSAVGFLERVLGADGALRGRPTLRIRLDPLDLWQARAFLPHLEPASYLEAYAACGGYPLHLRAWDERADTGQNLRRLAGEPGSVLLEDAAGILHEELPDAGGHRRILAAIGRGRSRYSQIADEAGQRIERPLDALVRAGFVEQMLPVGAPKGARPTYRIGDPYLAFWFAVLYSDIGLIEGGQGAVALQRAGERWQTHVGAVFEQAARDHAARLVARGELPAMAMGRWWATRGDPVEVDVLGLAESRTRLVGEARWQRPPLQPRDLETLRRKVARTPAPADEVLPVLWGRGGVTDPVRAAGALGFGVDDVIAG